MFVTDLIDQSLAYDGFYPLWVDESSVMRYPAAAPGVTLRLRIARGEQLGLVVGLASVSPAAFEILAVKSYGAVHCLNRILDDSDPRYISTGDLIIEANGRTHPTAMIHELLYSRCISLTLAKPRRADVASAVDAPISRTLAMPRRADVESAVDAPLSELGSCDETLTVFTPLQLFSATPESPRSVCDENLEPASSAIFYSDRL